VVGKGGEEGKGKEGETGDLLHGLRGDTSAPA